MGTAFKLRTDKNMKIQAKKASLLASSKKIKHFKGVKPGSSALASLPFIQISKCFVAEEMHAVFLGIVRQVTKLWFESTKQPYTLKQYIDEINAFILLIRPPSSFHRLPREISEMHHFKAYEWFTWLLYYSVPIVLKYLPQKYSQHWLLLVNGIYLLNKRTITQKDLKMAEKCFKIFVEDFPNLYSEKNCSYSLHQLLHLKYHSENFGPLWSTSAFGFEGQNGVLAHLVHGTKNVGKEIINNLQLITIYNNLKGKFYQNSVSMAENQCRTIDLETNYKVLLGDDELKFLANFCKSEEISIYKRANINGITYTSEIYKKIKTNDHVVKLECNEELLYGSIKFYLKINNSSFVIFSPFDISLENRIKISKTNTALSNILHYKETKELLFLNVLDINNISNIVIVGDYIFIQPHSINIMV